jgi:cell wall-associated NlpC family hydrolase
LTTPTPITGAAIVAAARALVGQPYRRGGWWATFDRLRGRRPVGIDCVALVQRAYEGAGVVPWRGRRPTTVTALFKGWLWGGSRPPYIVVSLATVDVVARPGDVLVLKNKVTRRMVHVGVYSGPQHVVSAIVPRAAETTIGSLRGQYVALVLPSPAPR